MYPEAAKQANYQQTKSGQILGTGLRDSDAKATCREKEIPERIANLFYQIESFGQNVEALTQRLFTVLSPEQPSAATGCDNAPDETQLGSQLREAKDRLQSLNWQMQSILGRLEL